MSVVAKRKSEQLKKAIKYHGAKKFNKARSIYLELLTIDPKNPQVLANLGVLEHQCGKIEQSLSYIDQGLALDPHNIAFLFNKGGILERLGNYHDAAKCYRTVIELNNHDAQAYYQLANCLLELGDKSEAFIHYQRAISINPKFSQAYTGLGKVYFFMKLYTKSIVNFDQAITLNPKSAEAYEYKGRIQTKLGKYRDAIKSFKQAIKLKPERVHAYIDLASCHVENCYWDDYNTSIYLLKEITEAQLDQNNITTISPFDALALPFSPKRQLAIAQSHCRVAARSVAAIAKELTFTHNKQRNGRLKIGYVSADFKRHTVAHLSQGLYGGHNRDQFEVFCYALNHSDNSEYRHRIEKESEHFTEIVDVNYQDAAQLIYDDGIDILVDLTGHTSGGRPEIFSLHPAPIQVNYLGFLGSIGANFIDYIITDEIVTPLSDESVYSEQFAYLPNTYQINSHHHPIATTPTRAACELPEDAFVLCCFNNNYKINPELFQVWMKILKALPTAVLWLLADNDFCKENLTAEAKKAGIGSDRLIFANKVPRAEHLGRIQCADLYLDTTSASARTSASDTLWAGLPIVTCSGNTFSNRIGASLLSAAGIPEMITHNLEDYYNKVIHYANNPEQLADIKQRLAQNIKSGPLFDTPRYIKNLEQAYEQMWQRYEQGLPAQHIKVVEA